MRADSQLPAAVMAYLCGFWDGERWVASNERGFEREIERTMYRTGYKRALVEFAHQAEASRPEELAGLAEEVAQALYTDGIVNPRRPPSVSGTTITKEL